MSRRAVLNGATVLSALAGALALPASGLASSGPGSGSGGSGLAPAPPPSTASHALNRGPAPANGNAIVTATGGGITITTRASAQLHGSLHITGQVNGGQGETVEIERLGHETHDRWASTVQAQVAADGTFRAVWHVDHIGRFRFRAVVLSSGSSRAASASPTVTITVYRPSVATIYGPGFYGNRTACGEKLGRRTLGVANRTLPCGTEVAIYYNGRTLIVPVIDRGPYANGADWDLTMATAKRLGIQETETIGAVSLPPGTPSPG